MELLKRIDQVFVHLDDLYERIQALEGLLAGTGDHDGRLYSLFAELRALEASLYDQMPKGV